MRNCALVLAAFLVASTSGAARAGQEPGGKSDRRPIVRFNASTRQFVKWAAGAPEDGQYGTPVSPAHHEERDSGGWVRANTRVVLRVINVNSYRESYKLRIDNKDFHTASLPKALEPFILTSTVQSKKETALRVVILDEATYKQLPQRFKDLLTRAKADLKKLEDALAKTPTVLGSKDLDSELLKMAFVGETNVTIRKAAVKRIREFLQKNAALPDLFPTDPEGYTQDGYQDFSEKDLRKLQEYSEVIPKVGEGPQASLQALCDQVANDLAEWDALMFRVETVAPLHKLDPAGFETELELLDQLSKKVTWTVIVGGMNQAQMEKLSTLLGDIRTNLQNWFDEDKKDFSKRLADLKNVTGSLSRAQVIFEQFIDPTHAPAYLDNPTSTTGDLVTLTVQIQVRPLSELKKLVAGLPHEGAPPGGGGGGTGPKPMGNGDIPSAKCVTMSEAAGGSSGGDKPADPKPDPKPDDGTVTPGLITRDQSLRVYGRWVLDYGLGLTATDLKQENFFKDANKKVRKGMGDSIDMGPAAVATFYPTTKTGFSIGPMLGISQGEKTRYLAGLSLVTGGKNRFTLSAGAAFGKVDRLFGSKLGDSLGDRSLETKSVFRQGHFISGTFTFTF